MDITKLIRDPKRIHDVLVEQNNKLYTKKQIKIYIPVRFIESGLAEVGVENRICGIYAIVLDDIYYGVSLVNAYVPIEPTSTMKIVIDGDDYYEFSFDAGSVVISNMNLVKIDTLVYRIYEEFFSRGRVPWYMGYLEMAHIFDTAKKYAGANIGTEQEVTQLLVSMVARNSQDRTKFYRQTIESLVDLQKNPPSFISMRNVFYGVTNTVNKLAGSYFNHGLVSAMVNPSTEVSKIESILRS